MKKLLCLILCIPALSFAMSDLSDQAQLGKRLFFDKRLSKDNSISCNSCHSVTNFGVDGKSFSSGVNGQLGGRNSPSVFNAKHYSVQFWDGRAKNLADQAKGPILNPVEMAMPNEASVVSKIQSIEGYRKLFKKVYGNEEVNLDKIAKAIAEYENSLVTFDSAYERYTAGDSKALSPLAIRGMKKFNTIGCTTCHSGTHFSGPALPEGSGFYQKFPLIDGSSYDKKYGFYRDMGRYEVTKQDSDRHLFRVPSLKNVEKTGPYFHNGSVDTLEEAVKVMAKTQLGKDLTKADELELVAFLKSLTGKFAQQDEPEMLK